jgi:hypothetical protein
MNAPANIDAPVVDLVEVSRELADSKAYRYAHHQVELHDAVDDLQAFAERTGLAADQDLVQQVIAKPFAWVRAPLNDNEPQETSEPEQDLSDFDLRQIEQRVQRWEMADPRDRWKHTAAPLPRAMAEIKKPGHRLPKATIDAFLDLVRLGDPERLKAWLQDHLHEAPALLKMLEAF